MRSHTVTAGTRAGFTLIELLIVVIIIAALAAMVAPRLIERGEEAKANIAKGDLASLTLAIKLYRLDTGRYPSSLADLLTAPSGARNWKGPYIENEALDPWGEAYRFKSPGVRNKSGFDLYSIGADGQEGTADDVGNWK